MIFDGLRNLISGMASTRAKRYGTEYVLEEIDVNVLDAAYRTSAMARKIIDIPIDDAVREWREWQADGSDISAIEAEEKRLNLVATLKTAGKLARLYGGSAVYIGTGETSPELPLNPETIRRGGIQYLTVFSRHQIHGQDVQLDPRLPHYGQPRSYSLEGITIHPSRFIIMNGPQRPNIHMGDGWGDSVLQSTLTAIKAVDMVAANIEEMTFEAKVDVIKIPDFMDNLRSGGKDYETLVIDRNRLAMQGKGINGALMMDAKEEYQQKQLSFASLPDIWDRFMIRTAAEADIPVTRLWGRSAAGLNATGESDEKNYNAKVRAIQTNDFEPGMGIFDECLIRSALGDRPDDVFYVWRPLSQPDAKDRAEIADKMASAFEKVYRMDVVPHEALGKAVVNAFTEAGVAPGLEADVNKIYKGEGDDDGSDDVGISDAAPRTLYVHRKVQNAAEIIRWAKRQGFKTTLPASDMHVTIAFSRQPVDWMEVGQSWQDRVEIPSGGARLMEQFGEARVLLFSGDELKWRHERIKEAGASWDHPEYQPHITISYDENAPDLADIEPYQGPIILGPEIFQEVKEDWMKGIEEK